MSNIIILMMMMIRIIIITIVMIGLTSIKCDRTTRHDWHQYLAS